MASTDQEVPPVRSVGVRGLRFSALSVRCILTSQWVLATLAIGFGLSMLGLWVSAWFWCAGVTFLILAALEILTFRHSPRPFPQDPNGAFATADGKIVEVVRLGDGRLKIRTYLNLLDNHEISCPFGITISRMEPSGTKRLRAHTEQAAQDNYKIWLYSLQFVEFVLFAGLIARKITMCVKNGDYVRAGQVVGMIHMGSGTVVILPADFEPDVQVGDTVRRGITRLAWRLIA